MKRVSVQSRDSVPELLYFIFCILLYYINIIKFSKQLQLIIIDNSKHTDAILSILQRLFNVKMEYFSTYYRTQCIRACPVFSIPYIRLVYSYASSMLFQLFYSVLHTWVSNQASQLLYRKLQLKYQDRPVFFQLLQP
jgi:hypothetical protein